MLTKLPDGLTYANVMATVAVFIALGGSSYAAIALKRNSVTSRHIAPGAVASSDVKDGSLQRRDLQSGLIVNGAQGPAGPAGLQGPVGLPGSVGLAGSVGLPGSVGLQGPVGPTGADGPQGPQGATGAAGSADTPSQVLAKLAEVDGAGSGLDADLLDGVTLAALQRRGTTTTCPAGERVTAIGATGDVTCAQDITAPTGAASGDLSGGYPGPLIAANAVTGAKVFDGSLGKADFTATLGPSGTVFNGFVVSAQTCRMNVLSNINAGAAPGDIIVPRITSGAVPDGLVMQPYIVGADGDVVRILCNATSVDISLTGSYTIAFDRIR